MNKKMKDDAGSRVRTCADRNPLDLKTNALDHSAIPALSSLLIISNNFIIQFYVFIPKKCHILLEKW